MPFRIVAERSDFPEHLIQSSRAKGCDVFDEDVLRLEYVNGFDVLGPEAASCATESGPFPCEADVLTGEPSTEEVNGLDGCPIHGSDVAVSSNGRPMLGKDSLTVWINFDLPSDGHSGSFKAKIKSSYTRKETSNSQWHGSHGNLFNARVFLGALGNGIQWVAVNVGCRTNVPFGTNNQSTKHQREASVVCMQHNKTIVPIGTLSILFH